MSATATATTPSKPSAPATATETLITPHLVCRDANAAVEFYKRALGAKEMRVVRTPDGQVLHAALTVGRAMFFLAEEYPQFGSKSPLALGGTPVTIHLHVPDVDAVFARATAAGCTGRMPPQDMFWGDRYGVFTDPFGHTWSVATTVRHVTDAELQQGAAACAQHMKDNPDLRCPGAD